ncbi:MAG: TetR/AcrR family transcriptional regulator [Oligoflexia bacterium]|nr:TetR/AcrR family transcriptional regulator [Oligoflexia bacterium]
MAKRSNPKTRPAAGTEDRLLIAATRLFAEKGYDGTSTKEICEAANANIAALHYHFDSKENLYLQIIRRFGSEWLDSALRVLSAPSDITEVRLRLEMFMNEMIVLSLKNIDLLIIAQNESESRHPRSQGVFQSTFKKAFETLLAFLTSAVKRNLLSRDVDPLIAGGMIFSMLTQAIRGNAQGVKYFKLSLEDPAYRKKWIQTATRIFLEGTIPR